MKSPIPDGCYQRRAVYYAMEDLENGLADWSRTIDLGPDFANAYFNRAIINLRRNYTTAGIADLRMVLEVSQDEDLRAEAERMLIELGETP